ncbi:hypothetical protein HGK82_00780 [Ochrobactrum sp. MT180101]|nr:hypothetical protein HGK82_00780 [Ochrobactrum sp. MT180101]
MDEYQQALADVAAWDGKSVIHLAQLIRNVEEKFWTVSEDWADDDHTITSALMYEVHC